MTFAATALRISSGVIVWALHFAAIYGFTALAALAIIVAGVRKRAEFESGLMAGIAALSLVAILWEAIPVLLVPACG